MHNCALTVTLNRVSLLLELAIDYGVNAGTDLHVGKAIAPALFLLAIHAYTYYF